MRDNKTVKIKSHKYVEHPTYTGTYTGKGCAICGFGPGSLQHNTTQEEWEVSEYHPYAYAVYLMEVEKLDTRSKDNL